MYYESLLARTGNSSGSIFALKNMGWSDKQEIKHDVEGKISITKDDISQVCKTITDIES